MKAADTAAVTTIQPTSNCDIIDLTGDDPNNTDDYPVVSVGSSVVVELIDDPPAIPVIACTRQDISSDNRQDIQMDIIGTSTVTQESSRNSSRVDADVLRRCKSTLELFAEVTRGVIVSLNNCRTLLRHKDIAQRSEGEHAATTDGIQCEQQRCVRCLESLLIASDFETKTVAYDQRINETSVRALIKRAYR